MSKHIMAFFLVATFLFICGVAQGQDVMQNKPYTTDDATVLLLHFDEGSGQVVKDFSGKGNDGQLGNGKEMDDSDPKWTAEARFGKALLFDGKNIEHVKVPHNANLNPGKGDFTIECWIKVAPIRIPAMIILKGNGMFYDYRLWLDAERHVIGEILGENSGTLLRFRTSEPLSLSWHHLAFVLDRDDAKVSGIYVDGQRADQVLSVSGWKDFSAQNGVDLSNECDLSIGIDGWGVQWSYCGIIDEVRISNVARKFSAISVFNESTNTEAVAKVIPVISRPSKLMVIDGSLEDAWLASPPFFINEMRQVVSVGQEGSWKGPQMLSGKVYLFMDEQNLYFAADVTDDQPLVNQGTGSSISDGCSIELYFGGKDRQDHPEITTPIYAPFEYQVKMGLDKDSRPIIWFGGYSSDSWSVIPSSERGTCDGPALGGELAAKKKSDGSGYILEARIPLSNFLFIPRPGEKMALDVGLNHAAQPGPDGKIHRSIQMMLYGDFLNFIWPQLWGRAYIWQRPLPAQEAAAAKIPQVQAVVSIAGDSAWEINGYREITKEVFGGRVVINNKAVKDLPEVIALTKEAGFESFFSYIYPSNIDLHGNWQDPDRPGYPKKELYEYPEKAWGEELHLSESINNLRLINPRATYLLCLQCAPKWMALNPLPGDLPWPPADPAEYARMASSLIKVFLTDPRGTRDETKYISFMNEPTSASWESKDFLNDPTDSPYFKLHGQKALDYYIKCFRALAKQLKTDYPHLQVGGPVAHGVLHLEDWYCWRGWTIKFLDESGPLCDFYDMHPYADFDNDQASLLSQATMIMNHVLLTQNRPLKTVLSEQNYIGNTALKDDPGQRFRQLLWNQRVLFMELNNPDKFAAHYYFLVYDQRVNDWGGVLEGCDLWSVKDGKLVPCPVLYMYRGLRDLRGTRLQTESSRPDVLVRSSLNGNRLTAIVFNDAYQEAKIDLSFVLPSGTKVSRILSSGWNYDYDKNQFSHFEDRETTTRSFNDSLTIPLILSPFATQSFVVEVADNPKPRRTVKSTEYYADRIFSEQAAETKPIFKITLPAPALADSNFFLLRMSWDGPKPDAVMVGNNRYTVPEQRRDITDIKVAEIPLKMSDVLAVTEVKPVYEKTYPNYNEKILFVSIIATEDK